MLRIIDPRACGDLSFTELEYWVDRAVDAGMLRRG
jgi:hypothetical protein